MKSILAVAAVAALLCTSQSALAVRGEEAPVVYFSGSSPLSIQQVAAQSPAEITALGRNIEADVRRLLGTPVAPEGLQAAASSENARAAAVYASRNIAALRAAARLIIDSPVPDVTPDNINDARLLQEIARVSALNALNARKREALSGAERDVIEPLGYCNVFYCGDDWQSY